MSERNAAAGERDRRAAQRDAAAGERERQLDEHNRALIAVVARLAKESQDLIERSQALLQTGGEDIERRPAAGPRPGCPTQEQSPASSAAGSEPDPVAPLTGPAAAIARAVMLRTQLGVTFAALAATEEEVARVHEDIAARRSGDTGQYRRTADEARIRGRQLRELERHFRD